MQIQQSVWLGVLVGWLAQLGLKTVLPVAVLTAIRYWSLETGNKGLWLENPSDATHVVWYALQASVFFGAVIAGALAALLSPRGSFVVPIALVILSLLASAFEQLPRPLSFTTLAIWLGGPCAGLLVGILVQRILFARDA